MSFRILRAYTSLAATVFRISSIPSHFSTMKTLTEKRLLRTISTFLKTLYCQQPVPSQGTTASYFTNKVKATRGTFSKPCLHPTIIWTQPGCLPSNLREGWVLSAVHIHYYCLAFESLPALPPQNYCLDYSSSSKLFQGKIIPTILQKVEIEVIKWPFVCALKQTQDSLFKRVLGFCIRVLLRTLFTTVDSFLCVLSPGEMLPGMITYLCHLLSWAVFIF